MLDVLFDKVKPTVPPAIPEFSLNADYAMTVFNHYFYTIIQEQGKVDALFFICLCIVASVMLGNLFRYLERIMASKIKVDIVKNVRREIFERVTRLQIVGLVVILLAIVLIMVRIDL